MAVTSQILLQQLTELKSKNDWIGIYRKFQPITELSQNDLIWNHPKVLSDIGFAYAKLAETGPKEILSFRAQNDKNVFLKQQAEYRKYAEQLRKRCIELVPGNAGYWSDLAYTYYQNVNELIQPRGRRDGNLRKEIENFLETVDKTLNLQPNRVQDLYRKGRILAGILPNMILWSKSYEDHGDFTAKSKRSVELRKKGIRTLLSAVDLWESLRNESLRKKHRKEYIRVLYVLSQVYYEKIKQDCWDESVFTLNLRDDVPSTHQIAVNQTVNQTIDQAILMIKKCCETDCPPNLLQDVKYNQHNLEKLASYNGIEEGTYKLYSIGKFFFAKYWILSGSGLKDTIDAVKAHQTAERYLQAAMKCQWSPQKAKQDKKFIAERLARVFISKGEYDQAISIIGSIPQKKLEYVDYYILHTWAIAMLKSDQIPETQTILDIAKRSKQNKELWLTHFLKGCVYLETDEIGNAQEQFELAHQAAERVGKKTVDSLLIAKAFVSYKSDKESETLKYLKEAQKLNPNRVSTGERIRKWQQSKT